MSDAQTTIILTAFAVVLILYVIRQERKSGVFMSLGQKKPRAILGSKNKNQRRSEPKGCENVSIDSPDFQRCAQNLGTGRTVVPVDPTKRPARIGDDFVKEDFLGNPFAKDLKSDFTKDDFLGGSKIKDSGLEKSFLGGSKIEDSGLEKSFLGSAKLDGSLKPISRDGAKAFPFASKGDGFPLDLGKASPFAKKKDLGMASDEQVTADKSMTFKIGDRNTVPGSKFPQSLSGLKKRSIGDLEAPPTGAFRSTPSNLGAAVSPMNLGMSSDELERASNRLDEVDVVQRTTGGQLNLLR